MEWIGNVKQQVLRIGSLLYEIQFSSSAVRPRSVLSNSDFGHRRTFPGTITNHHAELFCEPQPRWARTTIQEEDLPVKNLHCSKQLCAHEGTYHCLHLPRPRGRREDHRQHRHVPMSGFAPWGAPGFPGLHYWCLPGLRRASERFGLLTLFRHRRSFLTHRPCEHHRRHYQP